MTPQTRQAQSAPRRPTFLVLGAPKCGTTTLHHVLDNHPDIAMSRPKEPLFFEAEFDRGMTYYWQEYFAHCGSERAVGEARASKLFLPYVADRIKIALPDVKLIVILRNPVDRVYSHWWMRTCNGREKLPLRAALEKNLQAIRQGRSLDGEAGRLHWLSHISPHEPTAPVYLEIGHYAQHIRNYLESFAESQLKVLFFEDLCQRPNKLFSEIYRFLDVDPTVPVPPHERFNSAPSRIGLMLHRLDRLLNVPQWMPQSVRSTLKSQVTRQGRPPELDGGIRDWLARHYFAYNRQLEELLGRDLSHWDYGCNG